MQVPAGEGRKCLPIRIRRPARLHLSKTYAAEYVALACAFDCPLPTIDARLARAAAGEARMMGPADLVVV
ncbi:MAG: hypothetical protein HY238_01710 [Acidobacteria bacterium]|nr:hypothetical protein [Acidobacteriota bacterium]